MEILVILEINANSNIQGLVLIIFAPLLFNVISLLFIKRNKKLFKMERLRCLYFILTIHQFELSRGIYSTKHQPPAGGNRQISLHSTYSLQ